jgi:hypothetical protein
MSLFNRIGDKLNAVAGHKKLVDLTSALASIFFGLIMNFHFVSVT